MKNIIATIVFCSLFQMVTAQSHIPTIKNKTELNYVCKLHGQTRTLTLNTKMTADTLVFELNTKGVKNSSITIRQEALKKGNALSYIQGEDLEVLVLKPTETFFMISRAAYQDLLKNNKFIYNNTTYVLDQNADKNPFVLDGKSVDALHVIAQIDETEMWIVKNLDYPLICKMTKNPLGINFTLVKIEDK
ncbi:hypothetical protein SAMN05443549_10890 [Flavobacterium fluvii]|uniref:Gliding motility-associated protein GldM C-terminal domain-containing protein n=1 Tax=Flavobacterium fluvii TaxID=468056 RepID=A0A1M5NN88_9FLAO|nr:hypothetical protein [Flavobacterium fluvii]SHG90649.1 hypothetical protein SAMN05443549_10890 [Flavobacterium fluvii]